jgi:hypothetical protein
MLIGLKLLAIAEMERGPVVSAMNSPCRITVPCVNTAKVAEKHVVVLENLPYVALCDEPA